MAGVDINIQYVAHLARLSLSPEEEERLSGQLSQVLAYMEKLGEVETGAVEATSHPVAFANVTRQDEPRPCLEHEEAMRNAPATANGLFLVPKIVE